MARNRRRQGASPRVIEIEEAGRTARSLARWEAAQRIVTAAIGAAATVYSARTVAAGHSHDLNIILIVSFALGTIAAGVKIGWDRYQKQRQRERLTELERENRELTVELAQLQGEMTALRRLKGGGQSP